MQRKCNLKNIEMLIFCKKKTIRNYVAGKTSKYWIINFFRSFSASNVAMKVDCPCQCHHQPAAVTSNVKHFWAKTNCVYLGDQCRVSMCLIDQLCQEQKTDESKEWSSIGRPHFFVVVVSVCWRVHLWHQPKCGYAPAIFRFYVHLPFTQLRTTSTTF